MRTLGYKQYITEYIKEQPQGKPLYTQDIAQALVNKFMIKMDQAKDLVNLNMPRIADTLALVRYRKGIYYRAGNTVFGNTRLNPLLVFRDRYLIKDGHVIGYETGAVFFNQIGFSTQIPKYHHYSTNAFKHRGTRKDDKTNIAIRRPKTLVTEENYRYLQLLDAIENKEKVAVDTEEAQAVIYQYIQKKGLRFANLFEYANLFYNKKTILKLGEIIAKGAI